MLRLDLMLLLFCWGRVVVVVCEAGVGGRRLRRVMIYPSEHEA